jgi:hypothetical protein
MERRFAARMRQARELASRIDPGSHAAKVQRILGLVHSHRGDFAAAVRHLTKAVSGSDTLKGLLTSYLALGRLRDALERLPAADKIDKASAGLPLTGILAHPVYQPASGEEKGPVRILRAGGEMTAKRTSSAQTRRIACGACLSTITTSSTARIARWSAWPCWPTIHEVH